MKQLKIYNGIVGVIDGVTFTSEGNFNATKDILGMIDFRFGECYTQDFVSSLSATLEDAYLNIENVTYKSLGQAFCYDAVLVADKFEEIEFYYEEVDGDIEWVPEEFNEDIENGVYSKTPRTQPGWENNEVETVEINDIYLYSYADGDDEEITTKVIASPREGLERVLSEMEGCESLAEAITNNKFKFPTLEHINVILEQNSSYSFNDEAYKAVGWYDRSIVLDISGTSVYDPNLKVVAYDSTRGTQDRWTVKKLDLFGPSDD